MNPAEADNRNLDIDPLDQFGTMGPTDVSVDLAAYRFKVTGEVSRPLSLRYDGKRSPDLSGLFCQQWPMDRNPPEGPAG